MIFVSAGHNSKSVTIKRDPGAVGVDGLKEGDLTIEFRDLVCAELDKLGAKYIKDSDEESLAMYLKRVRTGSGSVVVEYHFDWGSSPAASGTTGLVEEEADRNDRDMADELTRAVARVLGVRNRGVVPETESHRGRLGLMREDGTICLVELCFISNRSDVQAYQAHKAELAREHARIIKAWEDAIQ
jgi:N-acetylmuramoyl-L-alanine amidase